MISYNSTQGKCAKESFSAIIRHLLNTYNVVNLEDVSRCYSCLRKLTVYLEKQNHKTAVVEGHLKSLLTCDKGSNTCRVRSNDTSKAIQPVGGIARARKHIFEQTTAS